MGQRRRARELALQFLYQAEATPGEDVGRSLEVFRASFCGAEKDEFFERIGAGVLQELPKIDKLIERFSRNWKLSRMSRVDRNILRLAVYEMAFCPDVPPKVAIDEAVELGKKFGTADSGAFINGVLDAVRAHLAERKPAG